MKPTKFRILSAITAGSLTLAVVAAITAGSGHTAQPAALAAQTESFPAINLDACPILHTGYPTGGCVAQMQTDLKVIQDDNLVVDGTFGSQGSQTYNAVIAFQKAHGLPQDGMVGPATKNALEAALSGFSVSTPVPEPLPPAPTPASPATTPTVPLNPSCLASTASSCGGFPNLPPDGTDLPNQIGKILTDFFG